MASRSHVAYRHSTNDRSDKGRKWTIRPFFKAMSFAAPRLTERFVEKLFFTPGEYIPSEEERKRLEQGKPFEVQVHGRKIRGWRWGTGPGILLIHGWSGRGIQLHRYIDPLLQAGRAAVAIDGPAHGASEGRSTSYFEFTDVIRNLIAPESGLCIQGIVGHSFGAAAAVNALAHQKAALDAVLIAPALQLRKTLLVALEQHGIPSRVFEKILSDYEARFGYSLERDDPHRHLGDLRAPALVIHDRDDPVIPHQDSEALCGSFEQVTLKTTSGLGHRKIMADPDVVHAGVSHLLEGKVCIAWPQGKPVLNRNPKPAFIEQEGSMPRDENISGTFRNGSAEERLDIFMEHPGLRGRFDEIEREEAAASRPSRPGSVRRIRPFPTD